MQRQALVEDCLTRSAALALDATLFSTTDPATAETRPAGLRNGIAALSAMRPTRCSRRNDGRRRQGYRSRLRRLRQHAAGTGRCAGSSDDHAPVWSGRHRIDHVLDRRARGADLIAIAPTAIVSAFDTAPEISVSTESVIHSDTAPGKMPMRQSRCQAFRFSRATCWRSNCG